MAWASSRRQAPRNERHSTRARRGVTLPIIAMLIVIFIGMAAFAVDFSRMYLFHGQLRTAAEAGALAGANRIIKNDGVHATDSAVYYAATNLVDKVAPDVGPADVEYGHWSAGVFTNTGAWNASNTNAVRVTTRHEGQFIFGRVYGQTRRNLQGQAIAVIGGISQTICVRPIAIPYQSLLDVLYPPAGTKPVTYSLTDDDISRLAQLTSANSILLKVGDASLAPASGNFYAVRLPPVIDSSAGTTNNPTSGANAYRDALSAHCPEGLNIPVGVGDWLGAENGNMVGPTRQGLSTACGVAPSNNFTCPAPIPMRVPIWDRSDKTVSSPNAFHVRYVGIFYAVGFTNQGNQDGIRGYFSTMAGPGTYDTIPGPLTKAVLRQ